MSLKHYSLLLFMSILGVINANGQKYSFLNYTVDDGLAHSQVRSIFQDSNAELWIGTLAGISRFDGQEFVNYSIDDGLVNNEIRAINQTTDGRLIFGGTGGFSIYDGVGFKNFYFQEDWKDSGTNHILIQGDSIILSTEEGLASFRSNRITYYPTLFKQDDDNVRATIPTKNGLAILTNLTLFEWTTTEFKPLITTKEVEEDMSLGFTLFSDLEIDSEGHMFITTSQVGLLEYFDGSVQQLSSEDGLVSNKLGKAFIDDQDQLMICSSSGVSHLTRNDLKSFNQTNGLNYEDIKVALKDNEGRYWLGSNGSGLFKFTGYLFTYYTTDEGLSSNAVMTIVKGKNDNLSFGTFDGGISMNGLSGVSQLGADDIGTNTVWTSTVDSNGDQWFGTSNGVHVVRGNELVKSFNLEEGLRNKKVTSIYYDSLINSTWVGTRSGVDLIRGDSVLNFSNFKGDKIRAIESGSNEVIYFGSSQGVWKYIEGEFLQLEATKSLSDRTVYCLKYLDNNLWIGTKNGLFKLDKDQKATRVILSTSFSVNTVNFLESDIEGNLWVGTNLGLFLVKKDLSIESFGKQDGLMNLETNLNSVYSDNENLWFGTSIALQRLNYSELNRIQTLEPPKTVIKEVRLNLKKTDWSARGDMLRPGSDVPLSPRVTHLNNNFSFQFHATSVEESKNLRYQYMLEGFDSDWQPVTSEPSATYTNLPFKELTFKVRSKRINQDWGVVNSYRFEITPPFWQTWWFILLSLAIVSYIAYSVFKYRRENLITALEKEKYEIKSKMLALEQQSLNSSMNRHFIFNALNSIQYYINRQDRLSANRYLSSFAKLIRKNLDSSQVAFTSLADEIERLSLYLEIENMRFKDKFDYKITVSQLVDEEVVQIPSMLLQPYLENSIWHGILPQEKKGKISVDIDKNQLGQMEIRIKDNGIGISTSQALKNGKAAHISKGMSITSGRIDLLKKITNEKVILIGPFEIKNEVGDVLGTQVTIKLPLEYKKESLG